MAKYMKFPMAFYPGNLLDFTVEKGHARFNTFFYEKSCLPMNIEVKLTGKNAANKQYVGFIIVLRTSYTREAEL